ncbi:alpha/beta fold hydrolase [Fuscibacter oryzae]|uniref:Alpha/beta hydrolase n=1 Tax=Fuscibacter oryzae TaxID=2803939 RepID=A0A8J7MQK4_9RHOB|nr:alpha/beta hydrolase [Fuscibacter oryzae]MBL4926573.1 alpha/beta hydrolase [Fuscibacter oryzae]
MADLLLVHGAGLGAWIWDDVLPHLPAAHAIDLPGRSGSPTTLRDQAQAILDHISLPTVLVGHSASGFAITAAALLAPEKVAGLIYLCAFIPQPGQSIAQLRRACPGAGLTGSYSVVSDRLSFTFKPDRARDIFFHDCTDASARLCAEPVAPQETALPARPACPSAAIFCEADRAIPIACQQHMAQGIPLTATLPCGHSPFLAMPARLATTIRDLSDNFRR